MKNSMIMFLFISFINLIFKINKALVTDRSLNQWVDLGVLYEACITVPDTCGPEGAAISVWVKIHVCGNSDGFLSSQKYLNPLKTGFLIFCVGDSIQYVLPDGTFNETEISYHFFEPTRRRKSASSFHGHSTNFVSLVAIGEFWWATKRELVRVA